MRWHTPWLILILGIAVLSSIPSAKASRLLIDDFNIPQEGIETDEFVEYDLIEDAGLFLGGRAVWGGPNNIPPSRFAVAVGDGSLQINATRDGEGSLLNFGALPGEITLRTSLYQLVRTCWETLFGT